MITRGSNLIVFLGDRTQHMPHSRVSSWRGWLHDSLKSDPKTIAIFEYLELKTGFGEITWKGNNFCCTTGNRAYRTTPKKAQLNWSLCGWLLHGGWRDMEGLVDLGHTPRRDLICFDHQIGRPPFFVN